MDFRYGIVIPINDLLIIEARKKKMNKEDYMRSLVEEVLRPQDTPEQIKDIWNQYEQDKITLLYDVGLLDSLNSLDPLVLGPSIIDGNIFMGTSDLDINDGLVPISIMDSLVSENIKNNVKGLLKEKGYGGYIPSVWINTSEDTSRKKYTSSEKLP